MPIHVPGVARHSAADKHYAPMLPRLWQLIDDGYNQRETAEILTFEGYRTHKGYPIHQVCVHRLLKRAKRQPSVTAIGAALAKQASIEAKSAPTPDEMMRAVGEQQRAELDRIELLRECPVTLPSPPVASAPASGERSWWMT
jgi:hypothetical protein